ncbi:GNAT family N-acetyltransferase [Gillisia sp. M10.2A]|uniref:GNAT family N-acetyltransferase n=1 Tax=Gillisia lutea TaxID=2909668 RepID=A0ABS9EEA0_9FLAO|nr:GNAT family N-acetyltransferase [Gillisia lutea]MCF4101202.1 GNAT family N-acetyltransferase [Gillisia lutea]
MKTDRLNIELYTKNDELEALQMFREKDIFKYIPHLNNKKDKEYLDFLSLKEKQISDGSGFYWTLRSKFNNDFIGAVNLTPIMDTGEMQIGWVIKSEFRKKGFALEAAQQIMNFAVNSTDYHPIYALFNKQNIASKKILEKLNFTLFEVLSSKEETVIKYVYKS